MTLDEAIKIEEKTSNNYYSLMNSYHTDLGVYLKEETRARNSAEYHEQLVEWLKELKHFKNLAEYSKDFNCTIEQAEKDLKVEGEKSEL